MSTPSDPHTGGTRRPRPPRRTFLAAVLLVAFMLVVRFAAGGIQLPLFFQRLVGLVNALLAMLVVVFAIRELAGRYKRLRWPLLGKVSTPQVAGAAVLIAVVAWWLSPWAPIPASEVAPDVFGLANRDLEAVPLMLTEDGRMAIAPPTPSPATKQAAEVIDGEHSVSQQAIDAAIESRFDDARRLIDSAVERRQIDDQTAEFARALVDMYQGRFDSASRRYGELLEKQPRREDLLARGALAAALAGQWPVADQRAEQFYEQAKTRGHAGARFVQAVNLLAAIRAAENKPASARQLLNQLKGLRWAALHTAAPSSALERQLAITASNEAVLAEFELMQAEKR